MFNKQKTLGAVLAALVLSIPAPADLKKGDKAAVRSGEITGNELVNVLWRDPHGYPVEQSILRSWRRRTSAT
jgi:hypothetical protein